MQEDRTIVESRLALANITLEEGRAAEAERIITELKDTLPRESATPAHASAEFQLVQALLAQNKINVAAQVIARAQMLSAATQRQDLRAMNTIMAARLDSARKQPNPALQRLDGLLAGLKKTGGVKLQLETRLAQCEIQFQSGQASAARLCSGALEKDAQTRGFKRIAEKTRALGKSQSD